jgi:hypothetical protein
MQAVRRLWAMISRAVESAVSRSPDRPIASVEKEVKARYLVLDTKQRSLSLSQEGMALLFSLLLQEPDVVFRSGSSQVSQRLVRGQQHFQGGVPVTQRTTVVEPGWCAAAWQTCLLTMGLLCVSAAPSGLLRVRAARPASWTCGRMMSPGATWPLLL